MSEKRSNAGDESARTITVSRLIGAPPELVFKAFTERDAISKWWGPNGFRTTTYEKDVRPGGIWRFTMHGPDGTDYPNRIIYLEVVEPELLRYEHDSDNDSDDHRFVSTVTFERQGRKTLVTLKALFATVDLHKASVDFGAVEGGRQTLARLDVFMAGGTPP